MAGREEGKSSRIEAEPIFSIYTLSQPLAFSFPPFIDQMTDCQCQALAYYKELKLVGSVNWKW